MTYLTCAVRSSIALSNLALAPDPYLTVDFTVYHASLPSQTLYRRRPMVSDPAVWLRGRGEYEREGAVFGVGVGYLLYLLGIARNEDGPCYRQPRTVKPVSYPVRTATADIRRSDAYIRVARTHGGGWRCHEQSVAPAWEWMAAWASRGY